MSRVRTIYSRHVEVFLEPTTKSRTAQRDSMSHIAIFYVLTNEEWMSEGGLRNLLYEHTSLRKSDSDLLQSTSLLYFPNYFLPHHAQHLIRVHSRSLSSEASLAALGL